MTDNKQFSKDAESAILIGFASGYVTCSNAGRPDEMPQEDMEKALEFISKVESKAREAGRKEMLEEISGVKEILQYIAGRNILHNAVCIPKAKEALRILKSKLTK